MLCYVTQTNAQISNDAMSTHYVSYAEMKTQHGSKSNTS